MSAHTMAYDWLKAPWEIPDPGNGGTFAIDNRGRAVVPIVTAAGETRILPAPQHEGQEFIMVLDTYGGACAVTVTSGYGVATVTLNATGDTVVFLSVNVAGSPVWVVIAQQGSASGGTEDYAADTLLVGGAKVSPYRLAVLNCVLNSQCITQHFYIADRALQVTGASYVNATAGTDAGAVNCQLYHDTGTGAPGSGSALLTNNANAGFNCKSTADTVGPGTLTATTANLQLAAGDRLSAKFTGTTTALAGVLLVVQLQPI